MSGTEAQWRELQECDGAPSHQAELLASHTGRPTEREAVDRGCTPASGEGRGDAGAGGAPSLGGPP